MDQCDCRLDSECTQTSADCSDATTDVWLDFNSVLTGALTVLGYLLYRFSQALPALIRWPIHIFCTLTGMSHLWGWVSHLAGTIRSLQYLLKGLSNIWRFIAGILTSVKQCVSSVNKVKPRTRMPLNDNSPVTDHSINPGPREPDLRLILMGPPGGGKTSLAETLLGCSLSQVGGSLGAVTECTRQKVLVDRRKLTVIDTPDLLGPSLSDHKRAWEALLSLQLASPGPHAFLLVLRAPGSGQGVEHDAAVTTRALLELVGEGASGHIVVVLTHADCLSPGSTLAQLLEDDAGGIRSALCLCGQRAELVDNSPGRPVEERRKDLARGLLEKLAEMRALRGHYTHELQKREDRFKKELLADMASVLALKLGQNH
ncbi:GTPase IMAP family member 4-like isoform X2 [Esox lucius]|uniref:AIG1-type G domain-containing protein n=1 Tax=Esox lucius TaxID=8010 RepID=A0AAY5KTR0_ESOLU|nr:GTPase IMAP family member 4-like isoform X2 [Esox lucius]